MHPPRFKFLQYEAPQNKSEAERCPLLDMAAPLSDIATLGGVAVHKMHKIQAKIGFVLPQPHEMPDKIARSLVI